MRLFPSTIAPLGGRGDQPEPGSRRTGRISLRTRRAVLSVGVLVVAAWVASIGCQTQADARADASATESIAFLSLDEFGEALRDDGHLLVVDFCVSSGRTDREVTGGALHHLKSVRREGLTVCRVDLDRYPQLIWEFGPTGCPGYIAFRRGEELFRAPHATPAAELAARLDASLVASLDPRMAFTIP